VSFPARPSLPDVPDDDYDDDDPTGAWARPVKRRTRPSPHADDDTPPRRPSRLPDPEPDLPDLGDRWSSFHSAVHGPEPRPDWVITERAAVDVELGILKTGKEADVHLLERSVPGTDRVNVLAAKRYRDLEHLQFTRDAAYLAGRRVRKSRDQRAMEKKTAVGRAMLGVQWANAEFGYLSQLWAAGAPVPYPVQIDGTELLMEFAVDEDGEAAPRLAQTRPEPTVARILWDQVLDAMLLMAEHGWTHGDLSAFNVLVSGERIVLIDVPQVIDVVSNPEGPDFLARDVATISSWFRAHGVDDLDDAALTALLLRAAGMR